jgi:hypothetical protein
MDALVRRSVEDVLNAPAADAVVEALRALGARSDVRGIRTAIVRRLGIDDALRRSSEAVSRGNIKVFTEIGRDLSRFLELIKGIEPLDDEAVRRFVETLPSGDPPDGRGLLRDAIDHLHRAMVDPDPMSAAQWQLLSNLEIGLHEQTRLQPEISAALDAAVPDGDVLVDALLTDLFPFGGRIVRVRRRLRLLIGGPTPLDRAVAALVADARGRLRRIITDHMMTLELPGSVLRLGADVPASVPESVRQIDNPLLIALLGRIDPTPGTAKDSAAVDWADFAERMHFIADLFRAWHEAAALLGPPFAAEQMDVIRQGRVPGGRL